MAAQKIRKYAARRERDKVRSVMIRASGYEAAAAWAWSVVHDPAGALQNPPRDPSA